MGLAGGIVRRLFSRSPCSSSAGGGRGHHGHKGSADHRRRWSSLRLYLCGEEMHAAPEEEHEEEDDGTVSVKSFETCVAMPTEAHAPAAQQSDDVRDAADNDTPGEEPQGQGVPAGGEEWAAAAATLIQSAFRGFMARRRVQELRTTREEAAGEPRSPTSASVATSVVVQVGESLSNLRLSEDSASVQQRASQSQRSRPPPAPAPTFRVKEEWDDSTVSSNVSRMRIQSRIEATTRRERALAYAFSQQLRSCGGTTKKRSARPDQAEFNVGWSWLERWMATRQAEPAADDCMSRNADTGSATAGRRVVVVRRRSDVAVEEKESCGSNDVSVVSFDGSSIGGRSGLSCHKPGSRSRLKGARNLPRRKVASSDHRLQARSHKVSKKGHHQRQEPKDEPEADGFDHACQPPTDY